MLLAGVLSSILILFGDWILLVFGDNSSFQQLVFGVISFFQQVTIIDQWLHAIVDSTWCCFWLLFQHSHIWLFTGSFVIFMKPICMFSLSFSFASDIVSFAFVFWYLGFDKKIWWALGTHPHLLGYEKLNIVKQLYLALVG